MSSVDWDKPIDSDVFSLVEDLWKRLQSDDPVGGDWAVKDPSVALVWCDASNLATGVCLEMDGSIVKDACWLRKQQDVMHINLAELDAGLKGVNLAVEWVSRNWKSLRTVQRYTGGSKQLCLS